MKTMRIIFTSLLLLLSQAAFAEDIDIYTGLGATAGAPNVMIIVDNAANSNAQMTGCTYWDGATPTGSLQGTKSLDNYMCALDNIAHGMATNSDGSAMVNLGLTTQSGVYLMLTPVDDNVYSGTFPHTAGQTNRQVISAAIRGMTDLPGNATQGTSFQETWAYYSGGNGGTTNVGIKSGTAYTGTTAKTGCQNNYAIFISGVTPSAHSNTDGAELTALTAAANNAYNAGTITLAQKTALLTRISSSTESPWAVEWSRFMKTVDINTTETGGSVQSITTYSVAAGNPVYPAAMGSMENYIYSIAQYGGGKYYAATSYTSIYQSILKILNEVQAVNSVFSSSSLPISVNAQGTYLNQIYMGMFRPDANANPRWNGNLKQYQFSYNASTNSLIMADSLGAPAISSTGNTGFISPNAVSFWTCGGSPVTRACSPVADISGGFWTRIPSGVGGAYDSPDGELVEKGGAAQIMRLANLTDDYTTTAGTSTNPRKLYTFCPTGSSCVAALADSSNAFATTNTGIIADMFGAATTMQVSSIVRTGTTALVTTNGAHGFADGASVTINGATPVDYDVTQAISYTNPHSANTFTITGLGDYPNSPSTGVYTAALHGAATQSISGVTLNTASTANANGCASGTIPNINCNQVRVTTTSAHGYSNGNLVTISGVTTSPVLNPNPYSGTFVIGNVTSNTFTYNVPVTPTTPSLNGYSAQLPAPAGKSITNITKSGSLFVVTATAHGFTNGQSVKITGNSVAAYNATWTVSGATTNTFNIGASGNPGTGSGGLATLIPPVISIAAGNISRSSATATTATATGITASAFSNGQTIYLTKVSGTNTQETEYAPLSGNRAVVITCSGTCTSFTFPITTNTGTATTLTTSSPTVSLVSTPVTIPAGAITRTSMSTTATVTGVANTFSNGSVIDISVSGTAVGTESAYLSPAAGWTITCAASCSTSFTFGPVTLTPTTPASGTITAYSGSAPPAKDPIINWVRGQDNFGDEFGPGGSVTVRPSLHGDVLHSRPAVINYGGTIGAIVYYGANDGIYHAVNGNQTNPAGSSLPAPGSELWGFIPKEFFNKLNRQRINSPMLLMPTTPAGIVPTPQKKDYFLDGATGVYQLLNADGTTSAANIYLSARRGGRIIYALNVSNPTSPQFLWEIDSTGLTTTSGYTAVSEFSELGQTWSAPKVASVDGYANPVLIFGAGYDTAEDSEPPLTDTMGRGIFIVDALTGALIWSAGPGGTTSCISGTTPPCHRTVSGMNYSIPADITLVDRDGNGKIDRLYAVDVGGNVWRVDLKPTSAHNTPDYWQVNKLAALGCSSGPCSAGTTPRKFFYPADVIPTTGYDAIMVGQGDREHPLLTDASVSIRNRIYMLKDTRIGSDFCSPSCPAALIRSNLFDATSTTYDGSLSGYYIKLVNSGEKLVNAPLTVAGKTYFGTNEPTMAASNSCSTNLGVARGYQLSPLDGTYSSGIYKGGGMPPSPVAGLVNVTTTVNGVATNFLVPFVIGGYDPTCVGADCSSSLGTIKPTITVPTSRSRSYWYQEMD